jgi:hypothetical protein
VPVAAPGGDKVARTKARASKLRGLMGGPASEITPYLFVGGSSGAKDEADLARRGITHVGEHNTTHSVVTDRNFSDPPSRALPLLAH